ncbi:hypothetical protein CB0940_01832 [Cercospora beticola]|uniref:Uncharacterized protein n=1 Tax=Cercospora beticola TaxID=122368 RepID=A0A2G5ICM6_CERBT|nr:hypothetical protein CB0940_01832 [Cercospora beticola]PIB02568.1 hypothetical protein CB0940_01832 [Cercospora beticola]
MLLPVRGRSIIRILHSRIELGGQPHHQKEDCRAPSSQRHCFQRREASSACLASEVEEPQQQKDLFSCSIWVTVFAGWVII